MEYNFSEDLKSIREILGFSQSELAEKIGVEQVTISRTELKKTEPSARLLEAVYSFAFDKNIKINKLKEMFWRDDLGANEKLLFHGAKTEIDGEMHFAPVSGHWCVCQWPLGATSGRKLIDHFVFDHNVIMFCYPLEQRVG